MIRWMEAYTAKATHRVAGLMSGTSVDGIDAACVDISGSAATLRVEPRHWVTVPFPEEVRQRILGLCAGGTVSEATRLNFLLGELFAAAVVRLMDGRVQELDLIGSHGQTVCHLPNDGVTLQLGEPSVIAERTGITTVAEFRYRDMAAGGQGAPLVPYTDYALLRDARKNRIIQNIGGIANLTYLPAGGTLEDVVAFDSGPGNMVIDECVRLLTHGARQYDEGGEMAARGPVDEDWLQELLRHPFFALAPPKSTGRELFGHAFAEQMVREGKRWRHSDAAIVATATALAAASIARAYRMLPARERTGPPFEVVLGGGGASNPTLRSMLQERVAPIPVLTHEDLGYSSDAKEAMAFAVLAHETVMGVANNVPGATGAAHGVVLGKIIPGRYPLAMRDN